MKKRVLYQTLEDRNNKSAVEATGPIKCDVATAWLCEGYYFWDSAIDTAKWWGKRCYANSDKQKGYIICKSSYNYGGNDFFDIAGDSEHIQDFWESVKLAETAYPDESLTVAFILAFMREDDEFADAFKAVRAYPIGSRRNLKRLYFENENPAYIEENPPIQLCIWKEWKSFLKDKFTVFRTYPYKRTRYTY